MERHEHSWMLPRDCLSAHKRLQLSAALSVVQFQFSEFKETICQVFCQLPIHFSQNQRYWFQRIYDVEKSIQDERLLEFKLSSCLELGKPRSASEQVSVIYAACSQT